MSRSARIGRLTAGGITVLAIAVVCTLTIAYVLRQELSFDGALNMQVSQNLLRHGRYATSYPELRDFHPAVQTGPTVLLPAALAFRVLGESSKTAQLPNAFYMAATAILIAALGWRWTNRWYAFLFPLFFLATPGLFDYGLRGYGEIPALAFFLLGLWLYDGLEAGRSSSPARGLAIGVAWGLAYLTKTIMLIAVPAIVCTALLDVIARRRIAWTAYLAMLAAAAAMVALFEAFKFVQLGGAYSGWWQNESGAIMMHAGVASGMNDTAGIFAKIGIHVAALAKITSLPLYVLWPLLISPYALAGLAIFAVRHERRIPFSNGMLIVLLAAGTYLVWWLVLTPTSRTWGRRIMDGWILHELALLTMLCVAVREGADVTRRLHRLALKGVGPWIMLALLVSTASAAHALSVRLWRLRLPDAAPDSQRVIAEAVAKLPPEAKLYGLGWWQAPVIAFLGGRVLHDIEAEGRTEIEPTKEHYLVIDHYARQHVDDRVRELLDRSDHDLVARAGANAMYRINRLYRFPWFARPGPGARILAGVDFKRVRYAHVRGFQSDVHGYMWGRAGASVLLDYSGQERLQVDMWFPPLAGYARPDLTLTFVLDQVPFAQRQIGAEGAYATEVEIPPELRTPHGPRAVALSLNQTGYRPDSNAAPVNWVFVVNAVAFRQ